MGFRSTSLSALLLLAPGIIDVVVGAGEGQHEVKFMQKNELTTSPGRRFLLAAKENGKIKDVGASKENGKQNGKENGDDGATDDDDTSDVAQLGSAFESENPCEAKKPKHADAEGTDNYFSNTDCMVDNVIDVLEQAGANVTKGYVGKFDADGRVPITDAYWKQGLCPVNVHWHLGAEHLSVGEFDDEGMAPKSEYDHVAESAEEEEADSRRRRLVADDAKMRAGFLCHLYDEEDEKFSDEDYEWQHCKDMHVGETYEVHWPHSAAGSCGTPHQFQTPFYDGVFCNDGIISLDPLNTFEKIGVQSQVFTVVNDEDYYYPDLIRGMIVHEDYGKDIAMYTGSSTGTSRSNEVCSRYTPITWQVDRKCHLISASSFDKLCADMKAQHDDMSSDLHPHGARELVSDDLTADNQQD